VSVSSQQVSVTTTATRLDPTTDGTIPKGSCLIQNKGSASVWLGNSTVTTANGFEFVAGAAATADLGSGDALYAVAASGTVSVHVLEIGGA
jgi:hypothetical protein